MVNPGGKQTMLGHWRIALRQAEEAARAGRFDEALALIVRPDVADHRLAVQLRNKLALDLVGRAARRAEADDTAGAMADLATAETHGAAPDVLAAARLKLAERLADEVRVHLEAGEPARVVEQVDELARRHVGGPALRRMREVADAWRKARDEMRRGEFGLARESLDRADRLAGGMAPEALAAARREMAAAQEAAQPRIERLYAVLARNNWGETLAAAEALLETLPDHPAARQARTRAWQHVGGLNPAATLPGRGGRVDVAFLGEPESATLPEPSPPPTRPAADAGIGESLKQYRRRLAGHAPGPAPADHPVREPGIVFLGEVKDRHRDLPRRPDAALRPRPIPRQPMPASPPVHRIDDSGAPGPSGRFLLWADAIGGYLVCLDDEIVLGRAGPEGQADVPLLGDLSRRHASLVRDGDGYVLRAYRDCFVNGRKVETALLRDGDVIRLGPSVELAFHQPSPVSATARLEVVSRHRLPVAVDGVVLMAETCIIGPSPQAHIPAPGLDAPVVLYRQGPAVWCRAAGEFEVDGRSCLARAPLTLRSSVLGEGFSFSLEPLAPRNPA